MRVSSARYVYLLGLAGSGLVGLFGSAQQTEVRVLEAMSQEKTVSHLHLIGLAGCLLFICLSIYLWSYVYMY